ncbi:MAG TPA: hypothetical protein VM120_17120, partial [Bryobacteraceae bacterium]|nr:hypothetical protein [Bryobacteraceae bacterium]
RLHGGDAAKSCGGGGFAGGVDAVVLSANSNQIARPDQLTRILAESSQITGELNTREYTGKDGSKKSITEIRAQRVNRLDRSAKQEVAA